MNLRILDIYLQPHPCIGLVPINRVLFSPIKWKEVMHNLPMLFEICVILESTSINVNVLFPAHTHFNRLV